MTSIDSTTLELAEQADGNLVLVISPSGAILSVIEVPDSVSESVASKTDTSTIDQLWPAAVAEQIRAAAKRALRTRKSHSIEIENTNDDVSGEYLFVAQGPDRVLMVVRDLTEQKRALSRVRDLAYTDDATGLPNREYLFAEMQKITDVQRLKEGRAALICVHVGGFDENGYALNATQQDQVLKELANRLVTQLRASNDNSRNDYDRYSVVTRTDFRQFTVVLPSIETGEDAEAVTERIVNSFKLPVTVSTRDLALRACAGVALYPQDGTDPAELYENALSAMEDARSDPTALFKLHSGTVRLRTLQRNDLEVELKSALRNNSYALNFLPVVDARTGMPAVIEALLRWPDTVIGTQPTRKIVRIAERTGLILPIGQWVLRNACEQLSAWHRAGHTAMRVAVNLSLHELVSDGIADRIEKVLNETQTSAAHLDFELKEHMLAREVRTDFATCRELKSLGARIVVDDYGTGNSSLAHLSQSPIDAIKIDNTFVANLDTDNRDEAACAAAIAMAGQLGIEVIAEGVETEQQADILRRHGCEFLQGFLISTPMTGAETLQYLEKNDQPSQVSRGMK